MFAGSLASLLLGISWGGSVHRRSYTSRISIRATANLVKHGAHTRSSRRLWLAESGSLLSFAGVRSVPIQSSNVV
jgi:hypothetical protein